MDFYITNGKIPQELLNYVLDHENCKVSVTIETPRTNAQNRLYFANLEVLTETGYTKDELHERIKLEIGTREGKIKEIWGKTINTFTTKSLSTVEFNRVMEFVYALGDKLGYYMVYPSDLGLEKILPDLKKK